MFFSSLAGVFILAFWNENDIEKLREFKRKEGHEK